MYFLRYLFEIFWGLVPGCVSLVHGLVRWVLGSVVWVLGFIFWVLGFVFWVHGFVFGWLDLSLGAWIYLLGAGVVHSTEASPSHPDPEEALSTWLRHNLCFFKAYASSSSVLKGHLQTLLVMIREDSSRVLVKNYQAQRVCVCVRACARARVCVCVSAQQTEAMLCFGDQNCGCLNQDHAKANESDNLA